MFYRPNFCCQCGEKIARARWTPWTSRRFCEFCEIEQKQHDLLPKVGTIATLLVGVAGLVSYLTSGPRAAVQSPPAARSQQFRGPITRPTQGGQPANSTPAPMPQAADANASPAIDVQRPQREISSTEAVYFCGALTKKGTACTRRVKTKGRCWQHAGQPAADPSN